MENRKKLTFWNSYTFKVALPLWIVAWISGTIEFKWSFVGPYIVGVILIAIIYLFELDNHGKS